MPWRSWGTHRRKRWAWAGRPRRSRGARARRRPSRRLRVLERLSMVRLLTDRLSGLLPWLKGSGKTFPLPSAFETGRTNAVPASWAIPTRRQVGIFENCTVRLERSDGHGVVVKLDNHPRAFEGWRRTAARRALLLWVRTDPLPHAAVQPLRCAAHPRQGDRCAKGSPVCLVGRVARGLTDTTVPLTVLHATFVDAEVELIRPAPDRV